MRPSSLSLVAAIQRHLSRVRADLAATGQEQLLSQLAEADDRLAELYGVLTEDEATLSLLRLIVASASTDTMVKEIAHFFRDWSGVEAVGVRLREGEEFPYYTTLGFPEEHLAVESSLTKVDRHGHRIRDAEGKLVLECFCGLVLTGPLARDGSCLTNGGSFWTNATSNLINNLPSGLTTTVRGFCNKVGFESVALIPLRTGDETFGLLQLNDSRQNRFSPDLVQRAEQLAGFVAAALD